MAEVESSSFDIEAFKEAASQLPGLHDALQEAADDIAGIARAHVAAAHNRYHGLGYKVSTRLYTTGGNPRVVVKAPLGSFLGTKSGFRWQDRAWGHVVHEPHPAADYVLSDAASGMETTSFADGAEI